MKTEEEEKSPPSPQNDLNPNATVRERQTNRQTERKRGEKERERERERGRERIR